jgi:hypothetical protein
VHRHLAGALHPQQGAGLAGRHAQALAGVLVEAAAADISNGSHARRATTTAAMRASARRKGASAAASAANEASEEDASQRASQDASGAAGNEKIG